MKRILAVLAVVSMLAACSDGPKAERVLADNGYTNIRTTGYAWFGCDKHDNFSTGFIATSPNGREVRGQVCSGFLKGSTIRFD